MLGGYGGMLPRIFFEKMVQFGAFYSILGPILALKILLFFLGFLFFKMLLLQTSLKNRERSGSVVECLNRDQGASGSSLTGVTALLSLSTTHSS